MAEEGGWTVYVPDLMDGERWSFFAVLSLLVKGNISARVKVVDLCLFFEILFCLEKSRSVEKQSLETATKR